MLCHPYPGWVLGSDGHLLLSFYILKAGFVGCSGFHKGRESLAHSYINTVNQRSLVSRTRKVMIHFVQQGSSKPRDQSLVLDVTLRE